MNASTSLSSTPRKYDVTFHKLYVSSFGVGLINKWITRFDCQKRVCYRPWRENPVFTSLLHFTQRHQALKIEGRTIDWLNVTILSQLNVKKIHFRVVDRPDWRKTFPLCRSLEPLLPLDTSKFKKRNLILTKKNVNDFLL